MTDELSTQIGTHKAESEKLFAGGLLLNEEYTRETCGWLSVDMISEPKVRAVWARVQAGETAHEAAMQERCYFDFASQMTRVVSSFDVLGFANAISLDYYLLHSIDTLKAMTLAVQNRDGAKLKELAQSVAQSSPTAADLVPDAVDVSLEFQALIDNLSGRSEMTGIGPLDHATGGLERQTLTLLAARPSMGKSSLGIQICKYKAEKDKKRTLLFSLEMNRLSIFARMACGELKIAWRDVRAGTVAPAQIAALKAKAGDLMHRLEDRLLIDDTPNMTIEDIWRKVSRYKPDFVMIDHLGLISTHEENEVKALGQVSWGCKMIAKQFDIPVMTLYQLNRGSEADNKNGNRKRPTMSDLRGSGKIEENADNIFFLYRPDYYDDAKTSAQTVSDTEIIIAKFRDGIRNIQVLLKYHLDEQHFYPIMGRLP